VFDEIADKVLHFIDNVRRGAVASEPSTGMARLQPTGALFNIGRIALPDRHSYDVVVHRKGPNGKGSESAVPAAAARATAVLAEHDSGDISEWLSAMRSAAAIRPRPGHRGLALCAAAGRYAWSKQCHCPPSDSARAHVIYPADQQRRARRSYRRGTWSRRSDPSSSARTALTRVRSFRHVARCGDDKNYGHPWSNQPPTLFMPGWPDDFNDRRYNVIPAPLQTRQTVQLTV
jgi:hypothetical protein